MKASLRRVLEERPNRTSLAIIKQTLTVKSLEEGLKLQKKLSRLVERTDRLPSPIRFVGGVDVAYSAGTALAVATVVDYSTLQPVTQSVADRKVRFPYVPGFLAFREIPAAVAATKGLEIQPDILLVDGHGYAHPRRCGSASHIGLCLGTPTIGVAKNILFGRMNDNRVVNGRGRIIGAVYQTPTGRSLIVSVGHRVSLKTAVRIVQNCTSHSLPEPIRLSHAKASELRRET